MINIGRKAENSEAWEKNQVKVKVKAITNFL